MAKDKSIWPIFAFSTFGLILIASTLGAKSEPGGHDDNPGYDYDPLLNPSLFDYQSDSSPTPPGNLTPTTFTKLYYPLAMRSQSNAGIPAIFTIAQSILESNSGNSDIAKNALNYFGIEADSTWDGPTYNGYRKYMSVADSFADHEKFLTDNSRYAQAFLTSNATDFAKAIAAAGYATDPDYANKIIKAMTAVSAIVNS